MLISGFHIARNTFHETLREPIYLLLLLSAATLIGLYPMFSFFVFRQQVKLVVDSAMATTMVFGWVTAVLSASHAICQEIRTGTALLVLSKPVDRPTFLAAKIAGILAALLVFWFLCTLDAMMAVRIARDQFHLDNRALAAYFGALVVGLGAGGVRNYVRRASYPEGAVFALCVTAPLAWLIVLLLPNQGQPRYMWSLIPAQLLVLCAVFIMGTFATAMSTRLDLVSNLLVCTVVFILGLFSDFLFGRLALHSLAAAALYSIIPNWQLFWMADALAARRTIPWQYVGWGFLYVLLFAGFFVLLAFMLFRNREVGRQEIV